MECEGYKKGKGNAGQKGVHFQLDLITLCLLNALNGQYKYWKISTENTMAGKFDDVVIELDLDTAVLIQAKHKENKKITKDQLLSCNSKNADFSLPKYFFSYEEIKNKFQARTVIICTNTEINTKGLEDILTRQQAQPYSLLYYEGNCSFYNFNENILPDLKKSAEAYLSNSPRDKGVDITMITEENLKDFIKNLQIFSCYPSEDNLHKIIEQTMSRLNCSSLCHNISSQEIRRKVEDWFLQPKGEYLTEARAKAMLCEIRSDKYCESLKDFNVSFGSDDLDIPEAQRIVHVKITDGHLLQILKVYYALQVHKSKKLYVNPDDAVEAQKLVVEAFSVRRYKFLIIVWDAIKDETEKSEIIVKVRDILKRDQYKQVILVADINANLAQQFGLEDIFQIDGSLTLQDLSEDSQERLLKAQNVLFQGHRINLDTLLYRQATEGYTKSLVDSAMLEGVVRGRETKVGEPLLDLDEDTVRYYVSRRFEARIDGARHTRNILSEKNLCDHKEKMIVISDSAGMGKSTVMTKMAMTIKETNPNLWVMRINLSDYTKVLRDFVKMNKTEINAAELLNSQDTTKITNKFEELVFSMKEKVVLMLDGADEISPDYTGLVLSLLNNCQKAPNFTKIFVTTRPHVNLLQKEVRLFQMLPFSELEQIDFLTNYWKHNLSLSHDNKDKCKRYAEILIRKVTSWTKAYEHQQHSFADIPLQARMLAEIFQENIKGKESTDWEGCKEYLKRDGVEVKLPEKFNMAKLYDTFIEKKRDIFIEKGSPDGSVTATRALRNQFESYLAHHRSLAVSTILPKYKALFISQVPEDKDMEECILKIGIVQRFGDRVQFIHRTFAEYFLADGIVEELKLKNSDANFQRLLIDKIFENDEFNIVRTFLDVLLHKVSLPTNIFKGYKPQRSEESNVDILFKLARDGHVAILRLILENVDFKVIEDRSVNVNDWRIKLSFWNRSKLNDLAVLVRQAGVNIEREDGETPLHLATKGGHLQMVEFLVKHGANVNKKNGRNQTALQLATHWNSCNALTVKDLIKHEADATDDRIKLETINWDIVKYLVEHGADVNVSDGFREQVLYIAILHDVLDIVVFLLQYGTQINMRSNEIVTALHIATYKGHLNIVKYLVDHGADVNVGDDEGLTALHIAAKFDKINLIEYLLKHDVDVNIKSSKNYTPLHVATFNKKMNVVKYLVENGADVNAGNEDDYTALHVAAKYNEMDIVKYLLERGADINKKNCKHNSALHVATRQSNSNIVKYLVEHGADINAVDEEGLTPLHVAAKFNKMDLIKYLLEHGVNVNIKNSENNTALYVATYYGNWIVAYYLVKQGAHINGADENGFTALRFAVRFNEIDNVKDLVEQGADVNAKNEKGNTVLHIAASNQISVVDYILKDGIDITIENCKGNKAVHGNNLNVLKYLVEHGADINAGNEKGNTALHVASSMNKVDIVNHLLENGVDINIKNCEANTALHLAVFGNNLDILKCLVEHGADINASNERGNSALFVATTLNNVDIAVYLLENGADLNMKNCFGSTALKQAFYTQEWDLVKVFVDHGADLNTESHAMRAKIADFLLKNYGILI